MDRCAESRTSLKAAMTGKTENVTNSTAVITQTKSGTSISFGGANVLGNGLPSRFETERVVLEVEVVNVSTKKPEK